MGFCFPFYRALFTGAPLYNSALMPATTYPTNILIQENQYRVILGFLSRPLPRFMGLVYFPLVVQFCRRPGLPPWAILPFSVFSSSWLSVLHLRQHLHQFHDRDSEGLRLLLAAFAICLVLSEDLRCSSLVLACTGRRGGGYSSAVLQIISETTFLVSLSYHDAEPPLLI